MFVEGRAELLSDILFGDDGLLPVDELVLDGFWVRIALEDLSSLCLELKNKTKKQ